MILKDNRKHKGSGRALPQAENNGKGKKKRPSRRCRNQKAFLLRNEKLIEQIHQIISNTPDIRPEKVGPLQEAVEQGNYGIDVGKLANILITNLLFDS